MIKAVEGGLSAMRGEPDDRRFDQHHGAGMHGEMIGLAAWDGKDFRHLVGDQWAEIVADEDHWHAMPTGLFEHDLDFAIERGLGHHQNGVAPAEPEKAVGESDA